jgi:hypothetical protein
MKRLAVALALALALAACSKAHPSATPYLHPQLVLDNRTTLTVVLEINGQLVGTYGPGDRTSLDPASLPPLPWAVSAQTMGGRPLATFQVPAGDLDMTTQPRGQPAVDIPEVVADYGGHVARADLTCGTLLVWAGTAPPPQGIGPVGTGADCTP